MKIVFTKGSGKYDLMEVRREGLEPERIECPKQGIIPHDMVHYAVEHTLKARGFLGRVKDGEGAGFQMGSGTESDSVERLVEVFQGDEMYRITCQARECSALPLDEPAVRAVRSAISDLSGRWQVVPVGGVMHLEL